jgi:deoxyribonuclease V
VAYGTRQGREVGVAAAIAFEGWQASRPTVEVTAEVGDLKPYQPGRFFERELPCLLAALAKLTTAPQTVIVDGYVWLDASGRAGLGAKLHQALGGQVAVVGVAKTAFAGSDAIAVRRGGSERPLYVTSAGLNRADAAHAVREMHGRHRLPDMLRRADCLGRERLAG